MSNFSAKELNVLRNCELLKNISDKNFETFINLSEKKTYAKGDMLLEEGTYSEYLFIIITGKVELYKNIQQKQHLITWLSDGQSVGEIRVIKNQPSSLTVIATEPTVVLAIVLSKLRHLQYNQCYESILDAIIKILSHRLIETNNLAVNTFSVRYARYKKLLPGFLIATVILFVVELAVAIYYLAAWH